MMDYAMRIWYMEDKATNLAELRDRLGSSQGRTTGMNTMNTVMLLCDRLQAACDQIEELDERVRRLEAGSDNYDTDGGGYSL
jgi:hypothetical protein